MKNEKRNVVRYILLSKESRDKIKRDMKLTDSSLSMYLHFKRSSLKARCLRVSAVNRYDGVYIEYSV